MLYCLIDHDNVATNLTQLNAFLKSWLRELFRDYPLPDVGDIMVRAYGGWWLEEMSSEARFSASQIYSAYCPALISTDGHYWRVNFEFADRLLLPSGTQPQVPNFHYTVVMRPAPLLKVAKVLGQTCGEVDCELQRCRRWLSKRRGCTRDACPQEFSQVWSRTEQKQVDIHLAIDLLQLCRLWPQEVHVAILSDDADFLPALIASSIGTRSAVTLTHVRTAGRTTYLDNVLTGYGVRMAYL